MKPLRILLVIFGIFGLIGVRMVEESLFYDPFLNYFHAADKNAQFPDFEWTKLIFNYLFRFSLNLALSALIVHFIFKKKEWTMQAVVLMLLVFAITFPIYMRRFVIQPLTLLLIIPLFYYRKQLLKKAWN